MMIICSSSHNRAYLKSILVLLLVFCTASCVQPGSTYYPSSPGGYGYDPYYYENQRERDRIEDERDRLERERWEFERERQREQQRQKPPVYQPPPPPPARNPQPERCPPGFSPSENRCSAQERKKGCKDIRLPGGLGCVKR